MTPTFLLVEFLVVSGMLLGCFRFGLTPVVVVVAALQFLQAILSSSIYWEFGHGLLLSPGSCVLFASNLAALLFAYVSGGPKAARTIFYTVVGANLVVIVFSAIVAAHIDAVAPINFLEVPPAVFETSGFAALVGICMLSLTQLLALTLLNIIRSRWPGLPIMVSMSIALVAALVFDTIGYVGLLFWSSSNLGPMLLSGTLSKGAAGLIFGLTWGAWAQRYSSMRQEPLRALFDTLTWSDTARAFHDETTRLYDSFDRRETDDDELYDIHDTFERERGWTENDLEHWLTRLPFGVCVVRDDLVALVNANFVAQTGAAREEEIRGRPIHDFVDPATFRSLRNSAAIDEDGANQPAEHTLVRCDGTTISVESVLISTSVNGEPTPVLLVRDISAVKQLQDQLSHSERLASMGTLTASVAHEINNPLAYLMANQVYISQTLEGRRDALDSEMADRLLEALDDAQEGARRIKSVIDELRDFARSDSGELTEVDVVSVIESSLAMAMPQIKQRAEVIRRFDKIPAVMANAQRLGQVLLNLLVNAAHAIDAGTKTENRITIHASTEASWVTVEIQDTGSGIAPELQDQIMKPFFTTKASGVGTGLGLATCRFILDEMGGDIGFRSRLGEGSTFWVRLPKARKQAVRQSDWPSKRPTRAKGARVMIIDDEAPLARAIGRRLDAHDVVLFHSGGEALAHLDEDPEFDVILCDLMMPNMSGMHVHQVLSHSHPELAERMIFITGGAFTDAARAFLEQTDNICLEKPLDWHRLDELLAAHM